MSRDPARLTIPIFPLSNVVLFPGARVPLHIFEPRYRQMTQEALAGERRIGMVTVLPDHVGEMGGDPPVFSVGCLGTISEAQQLPDGRFNVVLHGASRFRILNEPPRPQGREYRAAEVELLGESDTSEAQARVPQLRRTIAELFARLARKASTDSTLGPELISELGDATLVGVLSQVLDLPPAEKQGLLEADGMATRLEALADLMRFRLAAFDPLGTGSQRLH